MPRRKMRPARAVILCLASLSLGFTSPARSDPVRHLLIAYPHQVSPGGVIRAAAMAYDARGQPVEGVEVVFQLDTPAPQLPALRRTTDDRGYTSCEIECPRTRSPLLLLSCSVPSREGTVERCGVIRIGESERVLLTTDKERYQPGQTVRGRVLCLNEDGLLPRQGVTAHVRLLNSTGTMVSAAEGKTSRFGVFPFAFELADEISTGSYRVQATAGEAGSSSKAVTIQRYRLPPIVVEVRLERRELLIGEELGGTLHAAYSHGEPCREVTASVRLVSPDGADAGEWAGRTDRDGHAAFQMPIGEKSLAEGVEEGMARVLVRVTDAAGDEGRGGASVRITRRGIVRIIPEEGYLVRGQTNRIYVVGTRASPRNEETCITLRNQGKRLGTVALNSLGVAAFDVPVDAVAVLEAEMQTGDRKVLVGARLPTRLRERIRVRPSQHRVMVGDAVRVDVDPPASVRSVLLTASDSSGRVIDSYATEPALSGLSEIQVPCEAAGILTLKARGMTEDGPIVGTARVLVASRVNMALTVQPDRPEYRPREDMVLGIRAETTEPVESATEIKITDESLEGLRMADPGNPWLLASLGENATGIPVAGVNLIDLLSETPGVPEKDRETLAALLLATLPTEPIDDEDLERNPSVDRYRASPAFESEPWMRSPQTGTTDSEDYTKYVRIYADKKVRDARVEQVLFKMGLCLILSERYMQAGDFFREYADRIRGPLRPATMYWAGDAYLKAGDSRQAYRMFKLAHWDYPESKWAKYARGRLTASRFDRIAEGEGGGESRDSVRVPPGGGDAGLAKPADAGVFMASSDGAVQEDIRSFFPETLFYAPEYLLGADGRASLRLPLPDSITRWRVSAFAVSLDGRWGATATQVKVTQPFSVRLRLPLQMTHGDEVDAAAVVANSTDQEQTVTLSCASEPGVEVVELTPSVTRVPPGARRAVLLRLRANSGGRPSVSLLARGQGVQDAIRESVHVMPGGHLSTRTVGGMLMTRANHEIETLPDSATRDAAIQVTFYPSPQANLLGGLTALLPMPTGCFEQTVSTTYPNVLVLRLLRSLGRVDPTAEQTATRHARLGYQRILSYEVQGGGFEWYGRSPANLILTAYGLMLLSDLAKVIPVDDALVRRTRQWILKQRRAEGTWGSDGTANPVRQTLATACVCEALIRSGHPAADLRLAFDFIHRVARETKDPYAMTLALNTLPDGDGDRVTSLAEELAQRAVVRDGLASWMPQGTTFLPGSGGLPDVETTALAVMALSRLPRYRALAGQGIHYLATRRWDGRWGTTHATVLALGAFCACPEFLVLAQDSSVTIAVNGQDRTTLRLLRESRDAVVWKGLIDRPGPCRIELTSDQPAAVPYAVLCPGRVRWDSWSPDPRATLTVSTATQEGNTKFVVGQRIPMVTHLEYRGGDTVSMPIVRIQLPPGFQAEEAEFDRRVRQGLIARATVSAGEIVLYLDSLSRWKPVDVAYHLTPMFACRAQFPASEIYEYYAPGNYNATKPWPIEVHPADPTP